MLIDKPLPHAGTVMGHMRTHVDWSVKKRPTCGGLGQEKSQTGDEVHQHSGPIPLGGETRPHLPPILRCLNHANIVGTHQYC